MPHTVAQNDRLRNIAIIAHVDHGKTTLVDFMLRQSGTFQAHQSVDERVMDSMDLERERGITIASKNCSIAWQGHKINIIDTPGHADFGGEVERGLKMVDGAILLVDASEGPLPQTRFVLKKALEARLALILVINKIDRKDARPQEVLNAVYDLFIDLDADERQIDFPVLYAIGRDGIAQPTLDTPGTDLAPLLDAIMHEVPPPRYDPTEPFQMLVTNLAYSDYVGRLAVGRVFHGQAHQGEHLVRLAADGVPRSLKISSLQVYEGIQTHEAELVEPGDIVILSGIEEVAIGDTICAAESPKALPRIVVDEPTVAMSFMVNTSPLSGRDGKFVQSRRILERLEKETLHNVALRVMPGESPDCFVVQGRGEFQMAILIETMRREGFELAVGRPRIIFKTGPRGEQLEPIEHLFVDIHEDFTGVVTEKVSRRLGRMTNMVNHGSGRVRLEFSIPSRGLIGYRSEFLTDTKGTGLMNSYLQGYEPYRGDLQSRVTGSLVADRSGAAVEYGLFHLEPRGRLFVVPGVEVYEGMIIGEHNREVDLNVNACKAKKLTNMRAAAKDESTSLAPIVPITLEQAIEFIRDDEQVEVTPNFLRMRKNILPAQLRK
ncbi:MAG: translational GTPase TypA [Deltaproteobacteria bacterium]|nr:translational GTPase TypA [Deltaproteobacteria bacterium]